MGSLQLGNYVLILMGIALFASGPYFIYRTIQGVRNRRRADPKASLQVVSNLINVLIAISASAVGILFVVNNLRGNPF